MSLWSSSNKYYTKPKKIMHRDEEEEVAVSDASSSLLLLLKRFTSRTTEQYGGLWRRKRGRSVTATAIRPMSGITLLVLLSSIMLSSQRCFAQEQPDSRCFLDGGGATETFFIKESLPVGSLLGTLRVIGEPGVDIKLSLANGSRGHTSSDMLDDQDVGDDDGLPITVQEATKNLILTRPLDKEGKSGPSSVSVDAVCERIGGNNEDQEKDDPAQQPVFTVPVAVRVTDVNDNVPVFIGAPYVANVSELTAIGSPVLTGVRAVDADQPGPFSTVEYSVKEGKGSDLVAFSNPLEGMMVLTRHLDSETESRYEITIVARDQGSPPMETETVVTLIVRDADDQNPAFYHQRYTALLPEGGTQGLKLIVEPEDIRAYDQDSGLGAPVFYEFSGQEESDIYRYFELNRNTGHIYVRADVPPDELLRPVTLVIKATQFDNPDRYAVATLTVSRGGIYDTELRFLQRSYAVRILENVPLNSVVTTLLTNKPSDRRVHFYVGDGLPGKEFSVNEKGDVILRKVLDYETQENYTFSVLATDGRRNDTAHVNITLLNINDWDPRFKYPEYEFFVKAEDAFDGFTVGKLDVHDGDKGDQVMLDVRGPDARVFRVNRRGELVIDSLAHLNGSETHLVIVAEDSGIPPRRASVPVVVRFARGVAARIRGRSADDGEGGLLAALDSGLVVVIFAALLVAMLCIIVTLSVYICKHKRKYGGNARRLHQQHRGVNANGSKFPPGLITSSDYAGKPPPPVGHPIGYHNRRVVPPSASSRHSSRPPSASSRRSSSETLSSIAPPSSGAINPLNPRSGSQRYAKNAMLRNNSTNMSPLNPPPPPSPSMNSVGLPNPPQPLTVISADPMPNGGHHHHYHHHYRRTNGAIPKHYATGSVSSVRSAASSDMSLQQALRENILTAGSSRDQLIHWPRNSISRRVKKLSWEDDFGTTTLTSKDRDISTLTDPVVSVTPMNDKDESQQLENTVYF